MPAKFTYTCVYERVYVHVPQKYLKSTNIVHQKTVVV